MVPDATVWEDMDGETDLIKKLNSFLTVRFISRTEIPSDECLKSATHLAGLWERDRSNFEPVAAGYLVKHFATAYRYDKEKGAIDPEGRVDKRLEAAVWHSMFALVQLLEEDR